MLKKEAINFELDVPYMYLDSKGYLTVGIGHLISKLNGPEVDSLIQTLSRGDSNSLLPESEKIANNDLKRIMRDKSILSALEEVQKMPFRVLEVEKENDVKKKMFFAKPLPSHNSLESIKKAFVELLKQSIKLKAILKKDPDFKGYKHTSFFNTKSHPGPNNLVINEEEINKLFEFDVTLKIKDLERVFSLHYYKNTLIKQIIEDKPFSIWYKDAFGKESEVTLWKGYDDFPKSVQLALLDMAYNLGAIGLITKFPYFSQLVREERWNEILKLDYSGKPSYSRSGKAFALRNQRVGERFRSASLLSKLKPVGAP